MSRCKNTKINKIYWLVLLDIGFDSSHYFLLDQILVDYLIAGDSSEVDRIENRRESIRIFYVSEITCRELRGLPPREQRLDPRSQFPIPNSQFLIPNS